MAWLGKQSNSGSSVLGLWVGGVSILLGLGAHDALAQSKDKYFEIKSVKTEKLSESEVEALGLTAKLQSSNAAASDAAADGTKGFETLNKVLDQADVVLDKVIQMGSKVWKIVEGKKPVVNYETKAAHALPQGADDWRQLEGWKMPEAQFYHVTYTNFYGVDVVDFVYRVGYTYGGSVQGKGAYLSNVAITAASLSVAWGYTFDADCEVTNIVNAGTKDAPVAQAEVSLKYRVRTILKDDQQTLNFAVRGDGDFRSLNPSQ